MVAASTLGVITLVGVIPPAYADSVSGSKNCTGVGKVTPRITFPRESTMDLLVHRHGPQPQPTWSTSAAAPGAAYQGYTFAFVSPYAEADWTASDPVSVSGSAQCSSQSGPTTSVRATESLGSKTCSTNVVVEGLSIGEVWMSWKSETGSTDRNYVRFPDRTNLSDFMRTYTREGDIYDAKVTFHLSSYLTNDPDYWGDFTLLCK